MGIKELTEYSHVCGYLEKIYRQLNTDKFNGELEEPVITVQSTPRAYGHVSCNKIWTTRDSQKYELNIGADTIGRPIEETVSTMLHEMVHIYNMAHGIQDCSRNNTYHNKNFKSKAEEVGLIIDHDSRTGWSVTSPGAKLNLYIAEKGWKTILINRNGGHGIPTNGAEGEDTKDPENPEGEKPKRKPSSTRKYICPCCGNSVRATKKINIMCMDCEKQMIVEE